MTMNKSGIKITENRTIRFLKTSDYSFRMISLTLSMVILLLCIDQGEIDILQ